MRKEEFIKTMLDVIKDGVIDYNKSDIRFLFNDLKDSYHRDGLITDSQVQNWILTDKELTMLYKNK